MILFTQYAPRTPKEGTRASVSRRKSGSRMPDAKAETVRGLPMTNDNLRRTDNKPRPWGSTGRCDVRQGGCEGEFQSNPGESPPPCRVRAEITPGDGPGRRCPGRGQAAAFGSPALSPLLQLLVPTCLLHTTFLLLQLRKPEGGTQSHRIATKGRSVSAATHPSNNLHPEAESGHY